MAEHGIIGDQDFGTELPQMQPDQAALDEEKSMAKYAKSGEFQRIRDHFNERIAFYQNFLPNGRPVTEATVEDWKVANRIIGELNMIMSAYDNVKEANGSEVS